MHLFVHAARSGPMSSTFPASLSSVQNVWYSGETPLVPLSFSTYGLVKRRGAVRAYLSSSDHGLV
jgi:hypothetical protein